MVSAIGAIGFSMGRLLFLESVTTGIYESSISAYYAAESGIEEGLLRYRYNANSELPFTSWTLDEDEVFRSNLTNNSDSTTITPSTLGPGISAVNGLANNSDQIYDLRMGFIGTNGDPFYGNGSGDNDLDKNDLIGSNYASSGSPFYVPKDESLKIDLSPLTANSLLPTITLFANFFGLTSGASSVEKCKTSFEIKFLTKNSAGITREDKALLTYHPTCSTTLNIPANSMLSGIDPDFSLRSGTEYKLYFKKTNLGDIFTLLGSPVPNSQDNVELYIKPLTHDATIGLASSGCDINPPAPTTCTSKTSNVVMAGPYTSVQSTGYYGGVTRKLTADIDRRSGTVYDLFDYVIYKGQ